jgi:hypothetical protein
MSSEGVYIYILIVTCVLEKQTNLLEQTISPPPTYHVVYHDLYLIIIILQASVQSILKLLLEDNKRNPFPYVSKYIQFFTIGFIGSVYDFRYFITKLFSIL